MENENKEWDYIEIRYLDGEYVRINKTDLDKIEAIDDVVCALNRAKDLTRELKGIVGD